MRARTLVMALFWANTLAGPTMAATGWIPPRPVTALLPNATFAPGSTHAIELTVRANGAPANLDWTTAAAGSFALTVLPSSGSLSIPADSVRRVSLSVTVPGGALSAATLTVTLTNQIGGGQVAKVSSAIFAATGGRPEVWPNPSTWAAPANTSGSVAFQVHSLIGTPELIALTTGWSNPDPNNAGGVFAGSAPPFEVNLPAGGTITVNAPTTLAGSAYGGNANAVQLSVTSTEGISNASGNALVSAALADSLPTALFPVGLLPETEAAAGRDGATELIGRGVWLVPSGLDGVRVVESGTSLPRIGPVDFDGNGTDDRLVGGIRIPSYAASIAVIPGFVTPSGDTLDLGLLAAGNAGLMLLDLRTVLDPPFGSWEDFFDQDGNGIDDRILRTIPMSGFATDVAWFRASNGRAVALVAAADGGSNPVTVSYDPDSVAAGTGAGVVAIDVAAAIDSLGGVPYAAGTLPTPGSALDLELRGGTAPDLAIADGLGGVSVYHLTAAATAPATVTFTPRGTVALSSAWGPPYARDAAWVSNTKDSVYLAVAAMAGGVQLVRAPLGGAPSLVLAQQTLGPAIGIAGTWTATLAAAMGFSGVALLRAPSGSELNKIGSVYTAPVTLARGQAWTEGALEVGWQWAPSSAATSLRFLAAAGPNPDVLVSDGPRALLLRPGNATIVGVPEESPAPRAMPLVVRVAPNPISERAEVQVFGISPAPAAGRVQVEIFDLAGRLVRRIDTVGVAGLPFARLAWDGLDQRGRRAASGRYWIRARQGASEATRPVLLIR